MINPCINKYITVDLPTPISTDDNNAMALYRGHSIPVRLRKKQGLRAGKRRLWLRYSIMNEGYYLTDC